MTAATKLPLEQIHSAVLFVRGDVTPDALEWTVRLSMRYSGDLGDFARNHPGTAQGHGGGHATIDGVRYVVESRIGQSDGWECATDGQVSLSFAELMDALSTASDQSNEPNEPTGDP